MSVCFLALLLADSPALSIKAGADARRPQVRAVLPADLAAGLPAGKLTQEQGEKTLRLFLDKGKGPKEEPAILGDYERRDKELTFVPRFPLVPENTYRARLLLGDGKALTAEYRVPGAAGPLTQVVKIVPAGDVLPANHLRFYIYFSRPMRGGSEIFKQIRLVDDKGQTILDPWLLDELWDAEGKMLILYIHPGRIKWGVLLRLLFGPVLVPDREYTLLIPGDMLDADGRRLGKDYTKKFRTTAEDRTRIELGAWKLKAPEAGGMQPLLVEFPRTLDHLGLERFVKVVDAKGNAVTGKIQVAKDGRSWQFTPAAAWQSEEYSVRVDGRLEDVAGNTPLRPFDVDQAAPRPVPQRLERVFRPKTMP